MVVGSWSCSLKHVAIWMAVAACASVSLSADWSFEGGGEFIAVVTLGDGGAGVTLVAEGSWVGGAACSCSGCGNGGSCVDAPGVAESGSDSIGCCGCIEDSSDSSELD